MYRGTKYETVHARPMSKPVVQIDDNGCIVRAFRTTTEAINAVGTKYVKAVCKGKMKSVKGMKFRYLTENEEAEKILEKFSDKRYEKSDKSEDKLDV